LQTVQIERLTSDAGERLRSIRLRALGDAPDAFGTTFAEASAEPPESWENQLRQHATFVARAGADDIGLARGTRHDREIDTGYLISMWVAPEARRQGVGGRLIDAVVEWAETAGLKRLILDVAENNLPAMALYDHKSFVPNGIFGALPPPRDHVREIQLELSLLPTRKQLIV
jgi:GNAT superfamily N-acetyltransferase